MNDTVQGFYTKGVTDYVENYRLDHSPRLRALIDRYDLHAQLAGKRVLDIGGGLGFLGELLDPTTDYTVLDGATIVPSQRLCKGTWAKVDLDYDAFSWDIHADPVYKGWGGGAARGTFDAAFCLETLEHVGNPHHLLVQLKALVKPGGDVFLSVPTEGVTHNTPYPSLLWPPTSFALFLAQMALPITDAYVYQPKDRGWPAYQYRCTNEAWSQKRLLFPKADPKFRDCTPLEATNL